MKFLRSKKKSKKDVAASEQQKDEVSNSLSLPTLESTSLKPIDGETKIKQESSGEETQPTFSLAAAATAAAAANATASSIPPPQAKNSALGDVGSDSEPSDHIMFEDKSNEGLSIDLPKLQRRDDEPVEAAPAAIAVAEPPPAQAVEPEEPEEPAISIFQPPIEVTIDPQGIPPSPLRDNNADFPFHDQSGGELLNNSVDEYRNNASPVHEAGAPLGDIAMKTQLWDAQRLVRVILGRPQASDKPLETGSILKAIRVFAVMKQELILLRKQQEERDADPPAILETLGSPTNTTQASSSLRNFSAKQSLNGSIGSIDKGHKGIIEAAKKINSLERQLQHATVTVHKLQQQNTENNIAQLQQSKIDSQRQLTKTKADKDKMERKLKAADAECEKKEKKYQNLLRQFGEFQDFKSREFKGQLARKAAEIEELQQTIREQAAKQEEHELFKAHKAEMEKKLSDTVPDSIVVEEDWKAEQRALREELEQARLDIKKKDDIIQDLQDSQAQLQDRVARVLDDLQSRKQESSEDENVPSKPKTDRDVDDSVLKEVQRNKFSTPSSSEASTTPTKAASQRLQSLQEEHRALVATIQILEEEMKLGT